jgi:hypothetical protein
MSSTPLWPIAVRSSGLVVNHDLQEEEEKKEKKKKKKKNERTNE